MYRRLTVSEFQAVCRMLRARLRHVEIARELDLSLWTIWRIADRRLVPEEIDEISEAELFEDDAPADYVAANLRRCPDCGAMVYVWPCVACRIVTTTRPVAIPELRS
jgi:hypothetical protein